MFLATRHAAVVKITLALANRKIAYTMATTCRPTGATRAHYFSVSTINSTPIYFTVAFADGLVAFSISTAWEAQACRRAWNAWNVTSFSGPSRVTYTSFA